MNKLLTKDELPFGFSYPKEFISVFERNLTNMDPWFIYGGDIFSTKQLRERYNGLKVRYPKRELIPFARRDDNDNIACWENDKVNCVFLIHDYASEGYEQKKIYNTFWDWLFEAMNDMIERVSYEE